jgi:hypothetical protein
MSCVLLFPISSAVEGPVDEAVLRRLIKEEGATAGPVHGKMGKQHLRERIGSYNHAAQFAPWVVLVDLDQSFDCAPHLRSDWLPIPASRMHLRVAVREVETWLLADRVAIARFLGVNLDQVPPEPETILDPKRTMVDLAHASRHRDVREDMVPRPGSGRTVGPAYSARLIEFAQGPWQPAEAGSRCDSLRRCRECLRQLVRGVS